MRVIYDLSNLVKDSLLNSSCPIAEDPVKSNEYNMRDTCNGGSRILTSVC